VTKPENQDTTRSAAAFTRPRRLTAVVALSVGAGTLLYGTVLAFPADAASGTTASPSATSCAGSTTSAPPSATATATDTGTATDTASASASGTDTATDSPTAGPTASSTPSGASGSASSTASAPASASASATDCATPTATASASASATATTTAGKTHTATPPASASATKSKTTTVSGKGGPGPGQTPAGAGGAGNNNVASIPVFANVPTGQYLVYTDVPPGNASYQLPHGTITRAQIIARAQVWVQQQVPYSQIVWHTNKNGTYRQDCSGYVSMAWDLNQYTDFWTGNLNLVSHTVPAAEMLPGDILLSNVHTILFAGWANTQHTEFDYYEEAHPGTVARYVVDAPLSAFLDNGFAPFRYDGVVGSSAVPTNPTDGDLYSTLAQKASEIDPPGVTGAQPLGLGQKATASPSGMKAHLSAQVAADDSSDGSRSEGIALGVGGAFLLGAGLVLRRPRVQLRGGYRRKH
jgi:hypothetical protein